MAKKLIAVLGITGTQGGSVAGRFLTHAEWQVRGLTRNPGSTNAREWANRGVEIVKGDHDDLESLRTAFKGAHAIFAVTDWAANSCRISEDRALQEKARTAGRSIEEYAGDLEKAQGINIAIAASDPNVLSTLERFVFSTLPAVQKISDGKYKHSYEFDSKAGVESYIREELSELRARLSTVTMGVFQETWKEISAFRPHKQPDGVFEYVRLKVPGSHQTNPEVVATRDTGAFVEALVLHHPAEEEYVKHVPKGLEVTIVDDFKFFAEYGYAGGNPNIKTPAELGIKTTSLEEFFRGEDWSSVLKGEI